MSKPAQIARNLLLATAAVASVLAGCEGLLALRGYSFSFAPESVEFGWPDPTSMELRYDRDPDLFWVPRDYRRRLDNIARFAPDIVFLGDSVTELGRYPRDFVSRANDAAGARAKRIVGERVAALGWSSYQGLRAFERDVAPLRPRFVTVFFGWNDHWIGFGVEDADIAAIAHSPLERLAGSRVGQLLMHAHYAWVTGGGGPVDQRVAPEDFRANLRRIVAVARTHGIVPALLTAPSAHRRGEEPAHLATRWLRDLSQLVPLHQRYVSIVREVAVHSGAPLCDLASDFARLDPERVRDDLFMRDGIHLQPAGDERLAAFLVACFRREPELRALWTP